MPDDKLTIKTSNAKGKHWKLSEETKKKMSLAKKGVLAPWMLGNKTWLGRKHTDETREKMSRAKLGRVGPLANSWRGGLTEQNQRIRVSLQYRNWRLAIFERDNYTCLWCGDATGRNLNADHIKPFALYPELRFVVSNGRTLCTSCHKKTDTYGLKLSRKDYGK